MRTQQEQKTGSEWTQCSSNTRSIPGRSAQLVVHEQLFILPGPMKELNVLPSLFD